MDTRHLAAEPPPGRPPSSLRARTRTFHPRRGRVGERRGQSYERLWPSLGVEIPHHPHELLDLTALFGRTAPVVLEIGSGMGDATADMAQADPGRDYLAVEVHTPGIANLLELIEDRGLANVRVARGDALDLVRHMLTPDSLDAIHAFFPDPWPKARHHKRRLIQPSHVELLVSRLRPGGTLHCATDWADYAEAMLSTVEADPELVNAHDGFAPRPDWRPLTKFEKRGREAGRPIFDLIVTRRA